MNYDIHMEDINTIVYTAMDKIDALANLSDDDYDALDIKLTRVLEEFFNYPNYRSYN